MRPATEAGSRLQMQPKAVRNSAYFFAAPVVPGKEETWRRFLQEVAESRAEYERLRGYLGLRWESVWLVPSARGYATVVYLEIEGDLDRFVRRLTATEEDFDLWLKESVAECHGRFERAKSLPASTLDPIFTWDANPGRPLSASRPDTQLRRRRVIHCNLLLVAPGSDAEENTQPSTEEGDPLQR